jgi:TatD-related deoxyribonuclease
MPSVTASRKNIEAALSQGDRFLMETDYVDDRQRPGAVLGPKTVPRLTRQLMAEGILRESSAERIHREHVERTYGVEVTL